RREPLRRETHHRHGWSEIRPIWTTEQYRHAHRLRERRRRTPRLFRNRSRQSDNGAIDLRNGGRNKMGPVIESGNFGRELGQSFWYQQRLETYTKSIGDNIAGRTICAFGEACAWPTQSFVEKFPEEFAAHARKSIPPPLPPEDTPRELIERDQIPISPLAHDPGWEKAGADAVI